MRFSRELGESKKRWPAPVVEDGNGIARKREPKNGLVSMVLSFRAGLVDGHLERVG